MRSFIEAKKLAIEKAERARCQYGVFYEKNLHGNEGDDFHIMSWAEDVRGDYPELAPLYITEWIAPEYRTPFRISQPSGLDVGKFKETTKFLIDASRELSSAVLSLTGQMDPDRIVTDQGREFARKVRGDIDDLLGRIFLLREKIRCAVQSYFEVPQEVLAETLKWNGGRKPRGSRQP